MEVGTEELVGSSSNEVSQVAKGKRTKRLRLSSPGGGNNNLQITCSTSITASGGHLSSGTVTGGGDCGSFSSTETCNSHGTEDEEDMANCLILLAQGNSQKQTAQDAGKTERFRSRRFTSGTFVYKCKTCNRAFSSFQALGGHRASHKKPRVEEKKSSPTPQLAQAAPTLLPTDDDGNSELEAGKVHHIKINTCSPPHTPLRLSAATNTIINQNKARIHECSICGLEFSSGQALGGHMRRHRAATSSSQVMGLNVNSDEASDTAPATTIKIKSRNTLELDLNLPAPEDDNPDSKFQYTSAQRPVLVLSAPPLVDCHYWEVANCWAE